MAMMHDRFDDKSNDIKPVASERTFTDHFADRLREDAPLLAPLIKRDSSDDKAVQMLGRVTIYDGKPQDLHDLDRDNIRPEPSHYRQPDPCLLGDRNPFRNFHDDQDKSPRITEAARDTMIREDYRKQAEKLLNQVSTSSAINHGEGYYQVLARTFSGMNPAELGALAREVKHINGDKHILHKGGHFDLISEQQKKVMLDNIMNDYDRAHGVVGLNDGKLDPLSEKIADSLKAQVEKAAEPALKKSLELVSEPAPETAEAKPDQAQKNGDKTSDEQKPELPFEQRIRKTFDDLQTGFEKIRRDLELAEYMKKSYSADSEEYGWAQKKLGEHMDDQKKAIGDLRKLCQERPDDALLAKQLELNIHHYLKQKLLIVKKLHDTSVGTI